MNMSGTPDNPTYASPVYFADDGDPTAGVDITMPSWNPDEDLHYDGKPIPVPPGAEPEAGSDGHLTIVSADRRTAWEFWGCTAASPVTGFVTKVIVQWDLTGPGHSRSAHENSARGSGTPLIATSLRAEEALHGIQHALGITVPSVGGSPIYPPASHTDGDGGGIQYGMLFVLRPDYPVAPDATPAMRNVIQALKTYGAYVIDQGAQFEMDADNTHPELWAQTGIRENTFDFTGADFRLVHTPGVP
jgi:hypothetical protein